MDEQKKNMMCNRLHGVGGHGVSIYNLNNKPRSPSHAIFIVTSACKISSTIVFPLTYSCNDVGVHLHPWCARVGVAYVCVLRGVE